MTKQFAQLKISVVIQVSACALLAMICSGCGTFITHAFDEPHEAYNGVRFDAQCVSRGTAGFIIDMPFSAVADTLLLPVDLWPETQDPLKTGWTFYPLPDSRSVRHEQNTNHLDQAIVDDYKNYIAKEHLYPESNVAGFYLDAKGRCAVKFEAYGDHENASHVLIYDKNKRVKVVIFNRHRSVC